MATNSNFCVSCGAEIPEGDMICSECKKLVGTCIFCGRPLTDGEFEICDVCAELYNKTDKKKKKRKIKEY